MLRESRAFFLYESENRRHSKLVLWEAFGFLVKYHGLPFIKHVALNGTSK